MKADALNPRELFGTTVHYEIPAFQRPYVWTLDDQWQPLWQDVRRVAEKIIAADGDEASLEAVGGHFRLFPIEGVGPDFAVVGASVRG